ncbi:PhzF family phenazine biosynthesis protein [Sinisalibacter lacisalsi]|uniref:Phenazine antibiotic biosynthesis-like protein n=1 Tax=Sinisalibacter lacisalsi TaxID=1526570 RepID=A0ABQ1QNN0_9RHOB|nr:PhzF family phenazine biosynthesis protein [Sinisalibacter lacisalsi]GGD33594.1 phenazine antibiotic biosynthesis-like protein [Sinisalibacter lacisalsi]
MTDYLVYDVFTARRHGGNPLAILPDARALPEDELQAIAREFNLSETVFLYPPENPAHTARLRIFTPTMEVPFAGHPTIGAAAMLAEAGLGPDMVLELGIGPLAARAAGGRASFTTSAPLQRLASPPPALVARALGTTPDRLAGAPEMASLGLAFTFTELADRATLAALAPDPAAFREGAAAFPASLDFAQYAFVDAGDRIHARMFAPLDNIPEDPATGSAAATLAALLADRRGGPVALTVHQGDDMGRPSVIEVEAGPGGVTVAGQAVRVMEGRLLR